MLEHDDDDRYITQAIFDENQYRVSLNFVSDRDAFWKYLKSSSVLPSLILLNYHAGPLTAVGILDELKSNPRFQYIPVVVLSGSVKQDMVKDCYHAGASSFIQKPSSNKVATDKITNFIRYWFETVELI
jgi:CheY-like chemotaxis protein